MDRIDRQIVHCLLRDGRAAFDRIGAVVGVSPQTVARRCRALREAGLLHIAGTPDPRATNSRTWFARMICRPGTAETVGRTLSGRPDVSWVSVTSGGTEVICAMDSTEDPEQSTMLLDRLPRAAQILRFDAFAVLHRFETPNADWSAVGDALTPDQVHEFEASSERTGESAKATVVLTAEDAPLLDALASDGRSTITVLAKATGWPPARTSQRLHDLLASHALHIDVELNPRAFGFTAAAFLWMNVTPGELDAVGTTLSEHPETGFAAAITGRSNLMTAITCRTSDALYDYLTTRVGGLPGVHGVEVAPVLRRIKLADPRAGAASLARPNVTAR
ncbi:MAG TPA: AsnC family transcriptional regulator [Pseudonocardiaceae bacterium]